MRKLLAGLILFAAAMFLPNAFAGGAEANSVPFTVNYQGRLEMNNAPVNGTVAMVFRIRDAATGGNVLWTSPELSVTVTEGIFGVTFAPPLSVIGKAGAKYLQITVDNDTLSPAEQMNSVPFSYVSATLADGGDVTLSTMVTTFGSADAFHASRLYINGQEWTGSSQTSVATVYSTGNVTIGANGLGDGGHITFYIGSYAGGKIASFYPNGNLLLGGSFSTYASVPPDHRLMVDGDIGHFADNTTPAYFGLLHKTGITVRPSSRYSSLYTNGVLRVMPVADSVSRKSTLEVYSVASDTGSVNPALYQRGVLEMSGAGLKLISEGSGASAPISLETAGTSRLVLSTFGYVTDSYGTRSAWAYFPGDVYLHTGVRSGDVVLGAYGGSSVFSLPGEVMSPAGALILQASTNAAVGIGISTPSAGNKLQVIGNAYFENSVTIGKTSNTGDRLVINSSNTLMNGNLLAYTAGRDNHVELPTTTIYGTLNVLNGISVNGNAGAYLASTQTFTGTNLFQNPVYITTAVFTLGYPAIPAVAAGNGLFIVGGASTDSAKLSLVAGTGQGTAGDSANGELYFYRGSTEAARVVTEGGNNLAVYANGSRRAAFDEAGNIELALSTASATRLAVTGGGLLVQPDATAEPAVLVSAADGRVALATSTFGVGSQLTVGGSVRVSGTGAGIYFPDNSFLASASALQASAEAVTNATSAIITGGTGSGIGSVVLQVGAGKADVVIRNSVGPSGVASVGIGTDDPADRLHLLLGNLRVGARSVSNPFGGNSAIIENGLLVGQSAYLASSAGSVGIGTTTPGGFKLGVAGDVNTSGGIYGNGTLRLTAGGTLKNMQGMEFAGTAGSSYTISADNQIINLDPGSSYVNVAGSGGLYMGGTQIITPARWLQNINVYNQDVGTFISSVSAVQISANSSFKLSAPYLLIDTDGSMTNRTDGSAALSFTGAGAGISFSGTGTKHITAQNDLSISAAGNTTIGSASKSTFTAAGELTLSSPLGVPSGGTGAGTFTQNGILYGNAAGALSATAQGAASHLLRANGASSPDWVLATSTAGLNSIVLRDASGNAVFNKIFGAIEGTSELANNLSSGAVGQLPYQSAANTTVFLVPPAAGATYILESTGTTPKWSLATSTNGAGTVVSRDASGNFAAGTVTANLTGNVTGDLTGNVTGNVTGNLTGIAANASSAAVSVNLAGGTAGELPYQLDADSTVFLPPPAAGNAYALYSTGTTPGWLVMSATNTAGGAVLRDDNGNFAAGVIAATLAGTASSAENLAGGTGASQLVYQSASGVTAYVGTPGSGSRVLYSLDGATPQWRAASYDSTGNTVMLRDGSGNTGVATLTASSVISTGGFSSSGNAGLTTTVTLVTSTTGPTCSQLTFTGGLLTGVEAVACP